MFIPNASTDAITSFYGEFEFLSNFHPSAIVLDGEFYPTLEHAYQASKTIDIDQKESIRTAPDAKSAKRKGRHVTLIPDWDQVKVDVMFSLVHQKFNTHPDLKVKLLMTGNRELIEGNTWKDTFWGVTADGKGENNLGKILVKVRDEIRLKEGSALNVFLTHLKTIGFDVMNDEIKILADAGALIANDSFTDNDSQQFDPVRDVMNKIQ